MFAANRKDGIMKVKESTKIEDALRKLDGKKEEPIAILRDKIREVPANDLKTLEQKKIYHLHQLQAANEVDVNDIEVKKYNKNKQVSTNTEPCEKLNARKRKAYNQKVNGTKNIILNMQKESKKRRKQEEAKIREAQATITSNRTLNTLTYNKILDLQVSPKRQVHIQEERRRKAIIKQAKEETTAVKRVTSKTNNVKQVTATDRNKKREHEPKKIKKATINYKEISKTVGIATKVELINNRYRERFREAYRKQQTYTISPIRPQVVNRQQANESTTRHLQQTTMLQRHESVAYHVRNDNGYTPKSPQETTRSIVTRRQMFRFKKKQSLSTNNKQVEAKGTFKREVGQNFKQLGVGIVKGTVHGTREGVTRQLENNRNMESDVVKDLINAPHTAIRTVQNVKKAGRTVQRVVKGTYKAGKATYKAGKTIKRTAQEFKKAQHKAKFIAQQTQKLIQTSVKAARLAIKAAKEAVVAIVRGVVALGIPALIILVLVCLLGCIISIIGNDAKKYSDEPTMKATAEYGSQLLVQYQQDVENYKKEFLRSKVCNCDYGHNDTCEIQFSLNGVRAYPSNIALELYVLADVYFEDDITALGENEEPLASEIKAFMQQAYNYMYPTRDAVIDGKDVRKETYTCRENWNSDDQEYRHVHEYGKWLLTIHLRTLGECMDWVGLDENQKEQVTLLLNEFRTQMLQENDESIAERGYSLNQYFQDGGAGTGGGGGVTDLIDLGDLELTEVTQFALQYVGYKYVFGGKDINTGIDCSGFVAFVYANFGINSLTGLNSSSQANVGQPVGSVEQAQPGDLIFYGSPVHHVAMYIGNGLIVHASNEQPYPKGGVKVSPAVWTGCELNCIKRIAQ